MRQLALAIAVTLLSGPLAAADEAAVSRGAYIITAAGCETCHTDSKNKGPPLAGGRALATPFGTFYGRNITPDPQTGIGKWTEEQFHRAMRDGIDDDGRYLYPVFPYTSFTGMSDRDISDIYAYLMAQKPVSLRNKRHEVTFPFNYRELLIGWRMLFFSPGALAPVAGQSEEWNRGHYLAEAVVHCEECHTPRNILGALDRGNGYAGNPKGPDGQDAPNITSDPQTGIGKWSLEDIVEVLTTGDTPGGKDTVAKGMADVVDGTAKLTAADRRAIAVYIKSLPPRRATGK